MSPGPDVLPAGEVLAVEQRFPLRFRSTRGNQEYGGDAQREKHCTCASNTFLSVSYEAKTLRSMKPHVGRALREPAHKPGIPISAIGDENDGTAAGLREAFLFGALNAVEHLHFEFGLGNSLRCDEIR